MATLQRTTIDNTTATYLPKGTTAQRPVAPAAGMIRYNTDFKYVETYTGSSWEPYFSNKDTGNYATVVTSSGTHIQGEDAGYRTHTFFSGSHTVTPVKSGIVEVLVIAGGGGGGNHGGGGGGAGGVIYNNAYSVVAGTSYTVTVGEGGIGDTRAYTGSTSGQNSVFGTLTADGGGRGQHSGAGLAGGSGGGGSYGYVGAPVGGGAAGGAGTLGQGFAGGIGSGITGSYPAGGGGGAGGKGKNATDTAGGDGGPGLLFSISGTPTWYAGGGGGGTRSGVHGRGGIGGRADSPNENAIPNTGGGGANTSYTATNIPNRGKGARGIVIVRYRALGNPSVAQIFSEVGETTWICPAGVERAEILVVASGGGGGYSAGTGSAGGGGGAGGLLYNPSYPVLPGVKYNVTVGAGGAGATTNNTYGGNGGSSTFGFITTTGGGAAGTYCTSPYTQKVGLAGGSGGGGAGNRSLPATGGAGTAQQGNAGGDGTDGSGSDGAGGGGGAGAAGTAGTGGSATAFGGDGGIGVPSAISGTARYYAGGGGGGGAARNGDGGLGGGGYSTATVGKDGVNGTGGGGGGAGNGKGGNGGSGVVIVRYIPPVGLAGWKKPTSSNISGVLAQNNLIWKSERDTTNNYGSVIWNEIFEGDFELIASWQHNYMGVGMVYGSNVNLDQFTGYSSDGAGPYFGAIGTTGFANGVGYGFFGQYHAPVTGDGANTNNQKYYFKWARSGNTLTLQYSTTSPQGPWTNFNSSSSTTISATDKVICGCGEASNSEAEPLTFISLRTGQ